MTITLFENRTTDGSSAWYPIITEGPINLYVIGDLGGGTLTVEALAPDDTTAVLVDNGTITTSGMFLVDAASFKGRVTLSGSTSADVSVYIEVENVELRKTVRKRT